MNPSEQRLFLLASARRYKRALWTAFWNGWGIVAGLYLANQSHSIWWAVGGMAMGLANLFNFRRQLRDCDRAIAQRLRYSLPGDEPHSVDVAEPLIDGE